MPVSVERQIEIERIKARVRVMLDQHLDRSQIMERLGVSKGHATRLIRDARNS